MENESALVKELYEELTERGIEPSLCAQIVRMLNTDWTAGRLLGYLRYRTEASEEDIVDEMLAILSERERIRQKKEAEAAQSYINEMYMRGFEEEPETNDK